ncbi:SRPBCC family protein [Actinomadura sp. BRA 177]|uniref:SRPBCC family protein n=1 Tax=Actinomadura sp. BRA 177 TaxID=2745202 RepID=UPI001595A3FE|nr:SRPBCC family protein [Actinomadura sp. BRA 177]NVI87423.1 SRPBCC family protein [Actinomadura sp. BRA 177]
MEGEFAYTLYINTTPDRLWEALTDPAFTLRYWGVSFETDWKPGSTVTWQEEGATTADPEQVVLEAEPGRRLAYTWHTFTPEWAKSVGVDEETRLRLMAEPRSTVAFDIETVGETVRLTVVQQAGEVLLGMSRHGWPHVLSGLKTLLETGEPLPTM